jgi:hypothetical protein
MSAVATESESDDQVTSGAACGTVSRRVLSRAVVSRPAVVSRLGVVSRVTALGIVSRTGFRAALSTPCAPTTEAALIPSAATMIA